MEYFHNCLLTNLMQLENEMQREIKKKIDMGLLK